MSTNNELFEINAAFITGSVSSKEMENVGSVSQGNGTWWWKISLWCLILSMTLLGRTGTHTVF